MDTKCLHIPIRISGTGYLLDDSGLVLAYCSDGIPCAEMKEVVSIVNSHKDLLEALEACEKEMRGCERWIKSDIWQKAFIAAQNKAAAAIAKARGEEGK